MHHTVIAQELQKYLTPILGEPADYDSIMALCKDARFVLIGEASHGTHEFYQTRAEITKRLIAEYGFTAVAIEGDFPDCTRINRYVRGDESIDNAEDALADFKRFPLWMWRNTAVRNLIDWLYDYNRYVDADVPKAGFYGLDLYSLHASIDAVISYLDTVDPEAAQRARQRYGCFEHYGNDPQQYGYMTALSANSGCTQQIIAQLKELQQHHHDCVADGEAFFTAEQNAQLVRDAEAYYRAMFKGRPSSWNIRDTHMADTLDALAEHLTAEQDKPAKIVVWAHNSHIGDASATAMAERGEVNIGQLVRQRHGSKAVLIGFSSFNGTVTAASDWDQHEEYKQVNNALPESVEALFHQITTTPNFILDLKNTDVQRLLAEPRLMRFIGVIYRPDTERYSHYYEVQLPNQFDAIIHLDCTTALIPLEAGEFWRATANKMADDTYPTGL